MSSPRGLCFDVFPTNRTVASPRGHVAAGSCCRGSCCRKGVCASRASAVQQRDDLPGEAFELLELVSDGPEEDPLDAGSAEGLELARDGFGAPEGQSRAELFDGPM